MMPMSNDYLRDIPGRKELIRFVRDRIGDGFVVVDVTNNWEPLWNNFLFEDGVEIYKIIGDELVEGHGSPKWGFRGTFLCALDFKGVPMVLFQSYHSTVTNRWIFTGKEDASTVEGFLDDLLRRESQRGELYIWNQDEISLDSLDVGNFVVPRSVESVFEKEVYPQMDGGEIYNHVLLYSQPGTGKTAFCRYLAKKYRNWKTVVVTPSSIDKPKVISNVFRYASKRKPSLLIFEDIDTWARSRYEEYSKKGNMSPFLGALLNCIDGVETHNRLLVVATTNSPESLDPAILRPGRLGIHVGFKYTRSEMVKICNNYLGENHGASFYSKVLKNSPSHIRSLIKTAIAYSKLNGVEITKELLGEMDLLLKKSPAVPSIGSFLESAVPGDALEDESVSPGYG
jgi:hypothetical protein